VDESGISERPTRVRTWALKGQTPVIQFHFNWNHVSVIAGLTHTNCLFRLHEGSIRRLCQLTESETARRQIRLLVRKQSTDFGRVRRSRAMQRTELRVVCDRVKHAADAA